jgi:D-3-phosphoglycerate dehydrogenase
MRIGDYLVGWGVPVGDRSGRLGRSAGVVARIHDPMAVETIRIWFDRSITGVEIPDDVELVDSPHEADGVVVGSHETWDGEACSRYPRLKVVARSGVGYDNLVLDECAEHGVACCNAPDAPTVSTAEHALALILAVAKNLKWNARRLRDGGEGYIASNQGIELAGLTLGLVGGGRIGGRVGRYAKALGMRVVIHDPFLAESVVGELVDLDELWAQSDVVSLHAPATGATRHIVDEVALAAMKPGVVIVNCARGSLVDQDALLAALDSGQVFGAGLDVTEPEPLPPGHPLLDRDDVIVTPHIASSTTVGRIRLMAHGLEQAAIWLRGGRPEHLLNPEVLDPALDRRRQDRGPGPDPLVSREEGP